MVTDLRQVFENASYYFFIRSSNRNKFYFKAKKTKSLLRFERIKAAEFWEEFERFQNLRIPDEISGDFKSELLDAAVEEIEEPAEEKPQLMEQEEPVKKGFFDRSIF